MASFSGVTFVLFCFVFVCILFSLKPWLFVQSSFDMQAPRQPHVFFFFFPSTVCTTSAFSLYGEYVVRSFLPNGVFLPCDHGLDFYISLLRGNSIRSINQSMYVWSNLMSRMNGKKTHTHMVNTFSRVWINRVSLPVLLVDIRKRENDIFPVLVRAREYGLGRQVRRSRPTSAFCSFLTLKAERGSYLRDSPPYSNNTCT